MSLIVQMKLQHIEAVYNHLTQGWLTNLDGAHILESANRFCTAYEQAHYYGQTDNDEAMLEAFNRAGKEMPTLLKALLADVQVSGGAQL